VTNNLIANTEHIQECEDYGAIMQYCVKAIQILLLCGGYNYESTATRLQVTRLHNEDCSNSGWRQFCMYIISRALSLFCTKNV